MLNQAEEHPVSTGLIATGLARYSKSAKKINLEKLGLKDSKEIKEVQAQEERVRKFRQAVIDDKSGGRDLEIKKQRYLKADRDLKQMKHNKKDYRKYENFLREKEIEESKKTGKGRRGVYRLLKSGGG